MNNRLIVITGQTATGKTNLAYEYAKRLNGELINADSRQVYKYLNIISGKDLHPIFPTHLYNVVDPKAPFSSFEWTQYALRSFKRLRPEGKTPIIIGGSYLYIKHLLYGVETEGIGPDWNLRKNLDGKSVIELQQMLKNISWQSLQELNNSDRNNPRRLIRRIEIARSKRHPELVSGSQNRFRIKSGMTTDVEFIGLRFKSKDHLITAIKNRVEERIKIGAFEEVEKLLKRGFSENDPGFKTIGYQQLIKFFKNKMSKEKAIEEWIIKEIQYAKRQYMFMKKDKNIIWQSV